MRNYVLQDERMVAAKEQPDSGSQSQHGIDSVGVRHCGHVVIEPTKCGADLFRRQSGPQLPKANQVATDARCQYRCCPSSVSDDHPHIRTSPDRSGGDHVHHHACGFEWKLQCGCRKAKGCNVESRRCHRVYENDHFPSVEFSKYRIQTLVAEINAVDVRK